MWWTNVFVKLIYDKFKIWITFVCDNKNHITAYLIVLFNKKSYIILNIIFFFVLIIKCLADNVFHFNYLLCSLTHKKSTKKNYENLHLLKGI